MINSTHIKKVHRVLVVDDQEINRDVLGIILEEYYDIIYASDGAEALKMLEDNSDSISIVMLDIFMPNLDGFEVLLRMKKDERMCNIPVIVLTADKNAELKALHLGAADFLTKPFELHEIIVARVMRIIELYEGRKLISKAEHDNLTKLYSRNFFSEYTTRIFTYQPDMHMDAVVVDIEQFHSLNALHGRKFGDDVLMTLGGEIQAFLKETEGIASRIEADIFDIYCLHRDNYNDLFDRLQKSVNSMLPDVSICIRMGVKEWENGVEPMKMFDYARAACNMARGKHQNPIIIYDDFQKNLKS